jgi:putative endonuclease
VAELADLPAGRQARWKMCYTYAIKSYEKNYIYVGLSNNPERRIAEHNNGKERTTRAYAPFKTILIEVHNTRTEARKREKYLKSGIGKEYLKSL